MKETKGFILHPTYRFMDNKPVVHIYGKLENGENFLAVFDGFRPYFFIRKPDEAKAKRSTKVLFDTRDDKFKTFSGEEAITILLDTPKDVPRIRKDFENAGIQCFEADIRYAYRFLIDNSLLGGVEIHGKPERGNLVQNVFRNPELSPSGSFPELSVMSFDIETNSDASLVYSISMAMGSFKKSLLLHAKQHKTKSFDHTEVFDAEEELLKRFLEIVREKDPDIITGWNVIDFDLHVIGQRLKHHKMPFIIGRSEETIEITIQKEFFRESTAEIPGRMVLDGIHLLKTSFVKLEDYRLETAASELLGEHKTVEFNDKRKEIEEMYKKHPEKLLEYNMQDSLLVLKILVKTKVIELTIKRSLLSGMPLDRVRASIASLDSLYLRETRKRKLVCPSSSFSDREERIVGGFVRDSVPGIYDNIMVFDFKSLYPSVMRTFNIDPASFVEDDAELQKSHDPKKYVRCANGAFFRNEEGILPMLLQRLWEEREKARKAKDELERYAIKILMNSFFGVMASPMCRFYSLKLANGITHTCQMIIKLTAEKIQGMGHEVIYGDTDSIFMKSDVNSLEEAEKLGRKIVEEINDFYRHMIKKEYHRNSFLELEFEKVFVKFLMPKIRGTEKGAKKRYAGFVVKDGKKELELTGMEAIRSDWTDLAQEFQMKLLDQIFSGKDPGEYITELVSDLKKKKLDDKLVYRKRLTKDLKEYTKTTPPHVKAARLLPKLDGNVVYYVITEKGPQPMGHVKAKIDYEHYIEKQLKPIADSILSFQGKSFDDYLKGSSQKGLGDY